MGNTPGDRRRVIGTARTNTDCTEVRMESVVLITVPDLTEGRAMMQRLHERSGRRELRLHAAALVERAVDGRITVLEGEEDPTRGGTAAGATIGLVLGVLTGPIGLLVGAGTGASVGALFDVADDEDSWAVVTSVCRAGPPRRAAVVAVVDEPTPDALDRAATARGASVFRRPRADVERQLASAEQAVFEAYRDAASARTIGDRLRDAKKALTARR